MSKRIVQLVLVASLIPAAAAGQSLFSATGLGFATEPLDARSVALGGVGIGLRGATLLATDPAAAARVPIPMVVMTAQPSWVDFGQESSGESGSFRGTRFPSMGVAYPAWNYGMVTVSFETVFDQRYEAERPVFLEFEDGPVEASDEFVSEGGVSQFRLGFARPLGERLSVGVAVGRYTGSSSRSLQRALPEDTLSSTEVLGFDSFQTGGRWGFSGTTVTGGARFLVGNVAEVGGALTWSTALRAEASEATEGEDRSFDIPLQLRVGASAVLAAGLSLNAGFSTADWSAIDDDLLEGASVGTARAYGVGVELARATLFGRNAPLRIGYRHRDLPFLFQGGAPTETAWTGGVGFALNQVGELVRASLDLALERGERTGSTLTESFWRGTLTLRVAGF